MKFKVLGDDASENVADVTVTKSLSLGELAIVPCTISLPLKLCGYMAIVCKALLLLIPGLASMALDVYCKGPPLPVN